MFSAIVDLGCKVPAPVLRIITASGFTALFLAALNIARGETYPPVLRGGTTLVMCKDGPLCRPDMAFAPVAIALRQKTSMYFCAEGRFATSGEAFMSFVNGATAGSNAAAINAACSTFLLGQVTNGPLLILFHTFASYSGLQTCKDTSLVAGDIACWMQGHDMRIVEVQDPNLPCLQAPYIFLAACLTALALNLAAPWLLQKPSPVPVDRMLIPSSFTPAPVSILHNFRYGCMLLSMIKSPATWMGGLPSKVTARRHMKSGCRAAQCPVDHVIVQVETKLSSLCMCIQIPHGAGRSTQAFG